MREDAPTTIDAVVPPDASIPDAEPPPDATPTCQTSGACRMFASLQNLQASGGGGVAAVDALCNSDDHRPDTTVTYKALIADGSTRVACTTANCSTGTGEHIDWVLRPNREYRQPDGTTVVGTTTGNGVFTFPLQAAPAPTIVGTDTTYTGLLSDWTSSPNNCAGWTNLTGSAIAQFAVHNDPSSAAINVGTLQCSNDGRVLCVEQ